MNWVNIRDMLAGARQKYLTTIGETALSPSLSMLYNTMRVSLAAFSIAWFFVAVDIRLSPTEIHILIVCPQSLVGEGLRLLIEQDEDLRVSELVMNMLGAAETLRHNEPDVVIIVDEWVGSDCVALVQCLKSIKPRVPLMVIARDLSPAQVQAILTTGANGYLPLNADPGDLRRAVYAVSRGELTLHRTIATGFLDYLANADVDHSHPSFNELSPREQEVLAFLVQGMSDQEIAQALFLSVRTIQSHLNHLYAKLNIHTRTEAAVVALRAGWFPPSLNQK